MKQTEAKKLAKEIAGKLFQNGAGQQARRLILELRDGKDGGGWSEKAVSDLIERHLLKPVKG